MIFTQYLVVCLVAISLIGLFTAEFIRILKPELYPLKLINKILREKERHMRFGPQISMGIGCFSIIIIYGLIQPIGPLIICTSMTMAIFGDMTANLFGRTFGHKKIRNSNKTYAGLIAGIIVAFFSGIIVLLLLNGLLILNLLSIFLLPLIGALLIGLLDFLDLEIDDNLTYNFIISSVLFFFSFIFI
ncbi:MAG: phosphatidate cytidylyltransferase [Promethearchaeota archaeon]